MTIPQRIRGFLASFVITLLVLGPAMIWAADHAEAATVSFTFTGDDFYIPRPAARSDQVGVERMLASYDLAANGNADLIGLACSVAGTSTNGESVHPNNFGVLRSNGDSVTITGTEDASNGVRLSDQTIVLGATVRLYNVMIPDADDGIVATSVAYTVVVTCQTTTETTTTTTTTEVTTSTTIPTSTTSTVPTSTSTTVPTGSTTTTVPSTTTTIPTGSTTTTIPSTTTSTVPGTSTSTTVPPGSTSSTVPPVTTPSTLPFTGPEDAAGLLMAAVALLTLGGGVLVGGRRG